MICKCSRYDLNPKILCQLFDSFAATLLSYTFKTWGYIKSQETERIPLKFCKRLLRVKYTCTAYVYGELGRYSLYIQRYNKII